jgi:hypothetical protein
MFMFVLKFQNFQILWLLIKKIYKINIKKKLINKFLLFMVLYFPKIIKKFVFFLVIIFLRNVNELDLT